ncbi:hypothetical protein ACFXJ8_38815 [Nonomuraea sp. NPDC059194]|uniref:hypothetical protein n=1 Tax=Nonomuraea sp. NPDC059194 TaxID=3346764 RepID=UPI0036CAFAA3
MACVLVSSALHILAGGAAIRPDFLAGAAALTWAGSYLLGARQRGMEVLLPACFAAQYGMHHLFTAGAEPVLPASFDHDHGSGLGMLLVHALVGVVSAWWLERGESALATMLHLVVASLWTGLIVLAAALVEPRMPGRPLVAHAIDRLRRFLLAAGVSRRGPPLSVSVL